MEFPSIVDALRGPIDVQQGMLERNTDVPQEKRIEFRIGVNLGDVMIEGRNLYGDGVNIAARLEALAEPGGIRPNATPHRQRVFWLCEDYFRAPDIEPWLTRAAIPGAGNHPPEMPRRFSPDRSESRQIARNENACEPICAGHPNQVVRASKLCRFGRDVHRSAQCEQTSQCRVYPGIPLRLLLYRASVLSLMIALPDRRPIAALR